MSVLYLKKANDDVISHCSCDDGRVTFPPQMDCPWCGCGWLFSCITCRKAFTFAEAVELDCTWEELALADIRNHWKEEPSQQDVADWIDAMKELLEDIEAGELYVIIDGMVIPAECEGAEFTGWHAKHDFATLPQLDAMKDMAALDQSLAKQEYWTANAVEHDHS